LAVKKRELWMDFLLNQTVAKESELARTAGIGVSELAR
jgi:hypothetical protein